MPGLIEFDTLEEQIELCKELEFDFIELNMNLPENQPQNLDPKKLRQIAKNNGIYFTAHIQEEIDIANLTLEIRKGYLNAVNKIVGWAKLADVKLLNMHIMRGIYFSMPDHKVYLFEKYNDQYMKLIKEFVDQIDNKSVPICLENTKGLDTKYLAESTKFLLDQGYYLTWDIGHDFSSGNKDTKFYQENSRFIRHMHLHDGIGDKNHKELFTGEIDIEKHLDFAKENNCSVVIEVKTGDSLKRSVEELVKRNLK